MTINKLNLQLKRDCQNNRLQVKQPKLIQHYDLSKKYKGRKVERGWKDIYLLNPIKKNVGTARLLSNKSRL